MNNINKVTEYFPFIVNRQPVSARRVAIFALLCCGVLLVISIALLAFVPPVSRDALTHHLAIVKLYLRHGGIYEIPELSFSYYPMNLDLLYLLALKFGNDILPKYLHYSFALFTVGELFFYLKNRINLLYSLVGCLFFLSLPIIVKLSVTIYVDLGLIFFSTASLLLIFRWLDQSYQLRYLIGAAICCGLGLGVKYNGLIILLILTCLVPVLYTRMQVAKQNKPEQIVSIKFMVLFFSLAIVCFSPWLLRNYFWTRNPFYPLFDLFFHPKNGLSDAVSMNQFVLRHYVYHESALDILLLPIRIFFEGRDNNPQYFDGQLSPFLLILPFFAFLRKDLCKTIQLEKIAMLSFVVLYLVMALFTSGMRIRYISPIVPFLVIISIFGLRNIIDLLQSRCSRMGLQIWIPSFVSFLLVVSLFAYNALYIKNLFHEIRPFSYLTGILNRDQYISLYRPEYPLIQQVNNLKENNKKVLAIFLGNRGYYFDIPVQFDLDLQKGKSFFCEMIQLADSPQKLGELLRDAGITHLIIREGLFHDWIQKRLSLEELMRLELFYQTGAKKLMVNKDYALFSVLKL